MHYTYDTTAGRVPLEGVSRTLFSNPARLLCTPRFGVICPLTVQRHFPGRLPATRGQSMATSLTVFMMS